MSKITAFPILPKNKIYDSQFLISKSNSQPTDTKSKVALGDWNVFLCNGVNTIKLVDIFGNLIGLFIGCLIDYEAELVIKNDLIFDIELAINSHDWEKMLEDFIYQFSGSFLFILSYKSYNRVYLDANGTKSLVYDCETATAASTVGMILDDAQYLARFDLELYQFVDIAHDGWFLSGLTAHRGIQRLLCNHYLDLNSFEAVRHWPKNNFDPTHSAAETAARVTQIVKQSVKALTRDSNVICGLTGGNDTRFVLAACLSMKDTLDFCTVDASFTKKDVYISQKIAERLGLKYRLLPIKMATTEEQNLWQYQTGHCIYGHNAYMHPSVRQIANYKYFVGGTGGGVERARIWKKFDSDCPLEGKDFIARFGMKLHPSVVEATDKWFLSIKDFNKLTQGALGFIELRLSAWAFSQVYANPSAQIELHPMICRESYTLMTQLPTEDKRNNLFMKESFKQFCPELADIPVNKYGNYKDMLDFLITITDIKRVILKLRKLGYL